MTGQRESENCLGTVDSKAVRSKVNLVQKAKKIGLVTLKVALTLVRP